MSSHQTLLEVLDTGQAPPALAAATIVRSAVWHAFDQSLGACDVAWLHACSGAGKTWALRTWAAHRQRSLHWLSASALKVLFETAPVEASAAHAAPSIWVIDDAHRLGYDAGQWLHLQERLQIVLPAADKVLVLSQCPPPEKLRPHCVTITPAVLEVTAAESINLALCWGVPSELAEYIRQLSQGWIGIMRLAARQWQIQSQAAASVISLDEAGAAVNSVAYPLLQHQVLQDLPAAALDALALCGFLPRFNLSQASAMAHYPDIQRLVLTLVEQGTLITSSADTPVTFKFHRLLQGFLQDSVLPRLPIKRVNESVQRAVVLLEDSDDILSAARLLHQRGGSDAMVNFAKRHAIALADRAEPDLIAALIAGLNPKRMKVEGRLCLLGGLGRLLTHPSEAISWIDLAWLLASARQDHACLRRAVETALRNLQADNEPDLLALWMQRGAQMLELGPEPDRRTWLSLWSAYTEVLGQKIVEDPLFSRYLNELVDACQSVDVPADLRLCLVAQLAVYGGDELPHGLLQRFLRQSRLQEQPTLRDWVPTIGTSAITGSRVTAIPAYALQFALQVSESMIVLGEHEEASVWLELCQREAISGNPQRSQAMALSAVMQFQRQQIPLARRKASDAFNLVCNTSDDLLLKVDLGLYAAACALFDNAPDEALHILRNVPTTAGLKGIQRRVSVEFLTALSQNASTAHLSASGLAIGDYFRRRARDSLPVLWQLFSQPLVRLCCLQASSCPADQWSGFSYADMTRQSVSLLAIRLAELDVVSLRRAYRLFSHQAVIIRLMGTPLMTCGAWSMALEVSPLALALLILLSWAPGGVSTRSVLLQALSEMGFESSAPLLQASIDEINQLLSQERFVAINDKRILHDNERHIWLNEPEVLVDFRCLSAALPLARATTTEISAGPLSELLMFALSFTGAPLADTFETDWLNAQRLRATHHRQRLYRRLAMLRTHRD